MKTLKYGNLCVLSVLLLTACNDTNYKTSAIDENFGLAYKQVTQAQILNPDAAENPATEAPKDMDGQAGEGVINAFHQGFQTMEQTESISISVGDNNSSSGSSNN